MTLLEKIYALGYSVTAKTQTEDGMEYEVSGPEQEQLVIRKENKNGQANDNS